MVLAIHSGKLRAVIWLDRNSKASLSSEDPGWDKQMENSQTWPQGRSRMFSMSAWPLLIPNKPANLVQPLNHSDQQNAMWTGLFM